MDFELVSAMAVTLAAISSSRTPQAFSRRVASGIFLAASILALNAALAHLGAARDDLLGPWRQEELRAAMSLLGVQHRILGEDVPRAVASRYRDSGMAGTPSAEHPDAFVRADPVEAATMVAAHIRAVRPDVVVTYDEQGGYGSSGCRTTQFGPAETTLSRSHTRS